MITTRFYLDCRQTANDNPSPLKIVITKNGVRTLISTGVKLLPSQWDNNRQIVVGHPCKRQYNTMLAQRKLAVDTILCRLTTEGRISGLKASEIRREIEAELSTESQKDTRIKFISRFDAFSSCKSPGTKRIYETTRKRLEDHLGKNLDRLTFEMITPAWLKEFDDFLAKTSPARNARNIHFRNIRAVFNDALTDEVITCYPFRKYKLTHEKTRKRSLTVEKIRQLFRTKFNRCEQRYVDCFKLIFFLCGINVVDLCNLTKESVIDNRIEYRRAKTHKIYSIKIEPEAQEIIERWAGKDWLLNYHDSCKDYRSFYKRLSERLRDIGDRLGIDGLSTYWARHSWSTIARKIKISKDDIALALGHGTGHDVTEIYIDEDIEAIDQANRKVMDYVLYGS